ncbi:TolC family protein [Undibacterium sp. RuTC16W]|uniref:TolC family protein n=1 Tax=Undibacterium sp. RuTC16W TaxID=3413048 RepID=UPI003BEFA0A6
MQFTPVPLKRLIAAFACILGLPPAVHAQTKQINLQQYLSAVAAHSLDLESQQESVYAAKAGITIAGLRPDPQLTAGIDSKELYGPNKPNAAMTSIAGIAFTLETANKRDARIQSAKSNVRVAEASVASFKRQLFTDASTAFVETCRSSAVLTRRLSSLQAMRDIVRINEIRYKAGDIGKLEWIQSKLEADRFNSDVVTSKADSMSAELALSNFLGKRYADVFPGTSLSCELPDNRELDEAENLLRDALEKRDDVQLAKSNIDNARDNVELARANRWIDPVVNVSIKNTPRIYAIQNAGGIVTNSPAERSNTLGLTVTIPIPLSRTQSGELLQAHSALSQAELQLRSVRLKAETDVRSTLMQYQAAAQNRQQYKEHVLSDSDRVLEGVRTSYKKGSASMLELLNAQRSADDIYLGYLQAEANLANTKIKLLQSIGDVSSN